MKKVAVGLMGFGCFITGVGVGILISKKGGRK